MNIISHSMHGIAVTQRKEDGYINATKLSQAYYAATGERREVSEWLSNDRTKQSLKHLSEKTGIPGSRLAFRKRGRGGGTWLHPRVFDQFLIWMQSPTQNREEYEIQLCLKKKLGGSSVLTAAGEIDLLTSSELIEIKEVKNWKAAVGQVTVFSIDYPNHQKRLHLFGPVSSSMKNTIEGYCSKLNIRVTWQN